MSSQRFYNVSPLLINHVRFYFLFQPNGSHVERVTPNGTIEIEIQIDPVKSQKENIVILSRFLTPRFVRPDDLGTYFGIAFYPWAARPFLNLPLTEVIDKKISLEYFMGTRIKLVHEQVLNAKTISEKILVIENYLIKALYNPAKNDKVVTDAAKRILRLKGIISINELLPVYNLSRRRLEQRFKEVLGVSPKVYAQLVKFQNAIQMMQRGETKDMMDITCLCGYFDQAHFIHNFQSFSGTSPKKYLHENHIIDNINAAATSDLFHIPFNLA